MLCISDENISVNCNNYRENDTVDWTGVDTVDWTATGVSYSTTSTWNYWASSQIQAYSWRSAAAFYGMQRSAKV